MLGNVRRTERSILSPMGAWIEGSEFVRFVAPSTVSTYVQNRTVAHRLRQHGAAEASACSAGWPNHQRRSNKCECSLLSVVGCGGE
jgi:hypothetical protein